MNYATVKQQIHQIIISEVAKYYQKAITPAGLSLEDLKCLEIIAKMSEFEQDIKFSESNEAVAKELSVEDLLKVVRTAQPDDNQSNP